MTKWEPSEQRTPYAVYTKNMRKMKTGDILGRTQTELRFR